MQYTREREEIMKCKMVTHAGHIGEIQHPCPISVKTKDKKPVTARAGFIWLKL